MPELSECEQSYGRESTLGDDGDADTTDASCSRSRRNQSNTKTEFTHADQNKEGSPAPDTPDMTKKLAF